MRELGRFINAHQPKLTGTLKDSAEIDYWLSFITSLNRSNIIQNFISRSEWFAGLESPALTIYTQWLAGVFNLQASSLVDLKSQLFAAYREFMQTPASTTESEVSKLFSEFTGSILGTEMLDVQPLVDALNNPLSNHLFEINFWRVHIFKTDVLNETDIETLITTLGAINWEEFRDQIITRLNDPEVIATLDIHQNSRRIIKEISRNITANQLQLLSKQNEITLDDLASNLLQDFLQNFVTSLSGLDQHFMKEFITNFFVILSEDLPNTPEREFEYPDDFLEGDKLVKHKSLYRVRGIVDKLVSFKAVSSSELGELAALVNKYNLKPVGLSVEISHEAELWLVAVVEFVELWSEGHTDYKELTEQTETARRNFIPFDSPTVTRDCVARVAVEEYFQFLFANFEPMKRDGDILLVRKNIPTES